APHTLAPDTHRRDAQTLAHVIEGCDVERSGCGTTNVGPVTIGLSVSEQFFAVEDRTYDPRVVEMGPTHVRVVDQKDVARVNIVAECLDHVLTRVVEGPHVGGNVARPLHDRVPFGVTECR